MLNQLVESKSGGRENKTRDGYLLTTFVLVVGLCLSAVTYSLFAKDLETGIEGLELSTLVAPITESAPPVPAPKQEMPSSNAIKSALPSRQANILRIDESPMMPKEVSAAPNTQKARPVGNFTITEGLETSGSPNLTFGNSNNQGISGSTIGGSDDSELPGGSAEKPGVPPPAPPTKKPVEEKIQKPKITTITSGGVVNGKATLLPKPIYPAAAKSVKATGAVNVQVTIDETGNVVSAKAVDGHPLLRMEAEKAARNAKFSPTFLTGQAVKVSGIIVYKFSM